MHQIYVFDFLWLLASQVASSMTHATMLQANVNRLRAFRFPLTLPQSVFQKPLLSHLARAIRCTQRIREWNCGQGQGLGLEMELELSVCVCICVCSCCSCSGWLLLLLLSSRLNTNAFARACPAKDADRAAAQVDSRGAGRSATLHWELGLLAWTWTSCFAWQPVALSRVCVCFFLSECLNWLLDLISVAAAVAAADQVSHTKHLSVCRQAFN